MMAIITSSVPLRLCSVFSMDFSYKVFRLPSILSWPSNIRKFNNIRHTLDTWSSIKTFCSVRVFVCNDQHEIAKMHLHLRSFIFSCSIVLFPLCWLATIFAIFFFNRWKLKSFVFTSSIDTLFFFLMPVVSLKPFEFTEKLITNRRIHSTLRIILAIPKDITKCLLC